MPDDLPHVPLPKDWPKHARSAFVQALGLARMAVLTVRGWAANNPLERAQKRPPSDPGCTVDSFTETSDPMPVLRKKPPAPNDDEPFGARLARLRQQAGFSQRQLAAQLGISQRMVAYYERQTDRPPADLLPLLSEVLGATTDQLLGVKSSKANARVTNQRLWRRFKQIEKLPPAERRHLLGVIDAVLDRHRLTKRDSAA